MGEEVHSRPAINLNVIWIENPGLGYQELGLGGGALVLGGHRVLLGMFP